MNRLITWLLILAVPVLAVYVAAETLPYMLYNRVVTGRYSHSLYKLPRWDATLLKPGAPVQAEETPTDYSGLWRQFHISDVIMQLPSGHPLFHPVPIITITPKLVEPQLGLSFVPSQGREMARLHLLKSGSWNDQMEAQGLFRLPLVRRVLRAKSTEEVWRDVFTRKIDGWELPWREMVYNLYILHLRAVMLPQGVVNYGILPDGKRAVVELDSENKDYRTELVFHLDEGLVLSYLMVSDRNNSSAQELRARFLRQIFFRVSDPGLSAIIYREFKQLSFSRQTGEEGMLYLFSAWSHNTSDQELLKEMIYFLERGEKNRAQLRPLYRYALTRYNRTFTTRDIGLEEDDPDVRLQRKIELEEMENRRQLMARPKAAPAAPLAPKERMDEFLKQAREEKAREPQKKRKDKLIIY